MKQPLFIDHQSFMIAAKHLSREG